MDNPYPEISVDKLHEYVKAAGLDGNNPVDFQEISKLLANKKGGRLLEIGAGTGRLATLLIPHFKYVGIEPHQPYFEHLSKLFETRDFKPEGLYPVSFFDYEDAQTFDVILFSWTVISHFSADEQVEALKKSASMLRTGGLVLLDNPTKETLYNIATNYEPTKFYFEDWKNRSLELGFSKTSVTFYKTLSGREREITVLEK